MIKERLESIMGADEVHCQLATLETYSKDISFVNVLKPEYLVKPKDVNQVQDIVKLARETLTPIVTISSGPPHFRGDTVPSTGGALILDLSRMKKILRVDRLNRVAMCEPGVTFGELIDAIKKQGLRLNMPLSPRHSKSVIGSLLEREPVTMPGYQWDIADPLDCVEVVFGTGDLFRTGSAAGPGSLEEQLAAGGAQDEPLGPGPTSWYRIIQGSQGTMGVVTWATMRCELLPKLEEPFMVGSAQIEKLLDLMHWLIRLRLVNECFILNSVSLSALLAENWPEDFQKIKSPLPPWILFFNIAGYDYLPEERINYQIQDMQVAAQRVSVEVVKAIHDVTAHQIRAAAGQPSGEPYWKLRFKGACQDVFFLSTYDKVPEMAGVVFQSAIASGYPLSDIGIYLQPLAQGTCCHCEFNLFYNPANHSELTAVKSLSDGAVKNLMDKGAFFSRPYGENARLILNKDAATVATLKKIKAIFDPDNILNPGKLCF